MTPNVTPHKKPFLTPERRRWLYRIAVAALLVAVGYGIINQDLSELWLGLIAAVLSVADQHVPDAPDAGRDS